MGLGKSLKINGFDAAKAAPFECVWMPRLKNQTGRYLTYRLMGNFGGLFGLLLRLLSSSNLTLWRGGCASRFAGGFGDFAELLAVVLQDVVSHLGVAAMRREVAQLHADLDRGRDRVRDTVHQVHGGRRRTQEGDTAAVDVDVRGRHRRRVRGYVPLALGPLGGGGSLGGASPVGGGSHARTAARIVGQTAPGLSGEHGRISHAA